MHRCVSSPSTLFAVGAAVKRLAWFAASCLPWWSPLAWAQTQAGISIVPVLSLSQTLTDNRRLSATDRQSDLVTTVSPGIQITSRSGALQGSLNYVANGIVYARDSGASTIQNQLTATGNAEIVERRFSVGATASIGQQAISAFGTQAATSTADIGNRTEVATYSLSPLLQGRLLGSTDYRASLTYNASTTNSSTVGDSSSLNGSVGLSGRFGVFGWGADASRGYSEYDAGRRTFNSRVGGSLSMIPDPELRLALRVGRESSNLASSDNSGTVSWGGGVTWTPTPRTTLSLDGDRRYFGNSHTLSLRHRFARSIWSFSDSRSANTTGVAGGNVPSYYDIYYALFAPQFKSAAEADQFVRAFLRSMALDASAPSNGGFLSNGISLQRRQNLSVALQGQRSTVTLAAYQSWSSNLGDSLVDGDLGSTPSVRQLGFDVSVSYRLTPTSTINVLGASQRTFDSGSNGGNELRTVSATWQATLALRTQLSLGIRYAAFESDSNPYHETALFGSVSLRF